MNHSHQKLQLSKQDLKYVYGQVLADILQKLDLHLPTSNNDPMKNKVTNLLHDHLNEVFEMAKHAMVVDGVDMGGKKSSTITDLLSLKPKEKTEPFDFELNAQLREILQDIEHETIEVTNLRKSVPREFRNKYSDVVKGVDEGVSQFLNELDQNKKTNDNETNDNANDQDNNDRDQDNDVEDDEFTNINESMVLDMPNDKLEEMFSEYEEHLIQLNNLKNTLPKQLSEIDTITQLTSFLEKKYNEDFSTTQAS